MSSAMPLALRVRQEPISCDEVIQEATQMFLDDFSASNSDRMSDRIIAWTSKWSMRDGQMLMSIIRAVLKKATDDAASCALCARLCRKMMELISPKVQDDGIRNAEGKPITGGQLFRKYLLNRCQEDFGRGWVNTEATAAAAAIKAVEDESVKSANEKKEGGDNETDLYSDEYYAAQKAKRQSLGLIRFLGELFKLQMLTERIMHQCVQKLLLGNVDNPAEDEMQSVCVLLTTVGKLLDVPRAQAHMNVYFARIQELTKKSTLSKRMQGMLQNLIELRARNWRARTQAAGATTLPQIHEIDSNERGTRTRHQSILPSRDDGRNPEPVGHGGRTIAGFPAPAKAGSLNMYGRINKSKSSSFVTNDQDRGSNMRKSSADSDSDFNAASLLYEAGAAEKESIESAAELPSEEMIKKKVEEDVKDLFAIRNMEEAENYFMTLPANHHHLLIDKLVTQAMDRKEADVKLVGDLFTHALGKKLVSTEALEEGIAPTMEFIEDIAIDVPKVWEFMATLVKAACFDEETRTRLAHKSSKVDKMLSLLL